MTAPMKRRIYDHAENMEPQGIIVVLEAPAYYLEEAEVLEMASAIKARMEER